MNIAAPYLLRMISNTQIMRDAAQCAMTSAASGVSGHLITWAVTAYAMIAGNLSQCRKAGLFLVNHTVTEEDIMREPTEQRDRKELLILAEMYLSTRRCVGEHIIYDGYVCPWCNSDDPEGCCLKENIHSEYVSPRGYKRCQHFNNKQKK